MKVRFQRWYISFGILSILSIFALLPNTAFAATMPAHNLAHNAYNSGPNFVPCNPGLVYDSVSLQNGSGFITNAPYSIRNDLDQSITGHATASASTTFSFSVNASIGLDFSLFENSVKTSLGITVSSQSTASSGISTDFPVAAHTVGHADWGVAYVTVVGHYYSINNRCAIVQDNGFVEASAPTSNQWHIYSTPN